MKQRTLQRLPVLSSGISKIRIAYDDLTSLLGNAFKFGVGHVSRLVVLVIKAL